MVIAEQEANRNYEEYLAAIGTGPCSQDMVMRADVKLTIEQVWHLSYCEIICVALLIGQRELITMSKRVFFWQVGGGGGGGDMLRTK